MIEAAGIVLGLLALVGIKVEIKNDDEIDAWIARQSAARRNY